MSDITITEVQGIGKKVYSKLGIEDLRPRSALLQRRIGWEKGARDLGESYNISVALRPPNGFTYAGSAGSSSTALKAARNMVIKPAVVTPFEIDLRESVLWVALSRAAKAGEGAFASLSSEIFKAMKVSASNRLEAASLIGQQSLGTVESVTSAGGQLADVVITSPTWRPGLWWAMGEKSTYDTFTSTTKNNASGALVLEKITSSTRTLQFTFVGTMGSEIAVGDVIYFEGAWDGTTYYEPPGLITQAKNTTGTSLGLSAGTYSNWQGNVYDVAGNISTDSMEDAFSQLRDRGAAGVLTEYISNKGQSALLSELKSQRVLDQSYSPVKQKTGSKAIELDTPDIGEVQVLNHPFLAWGEFLVQSDEDCGRVGSSDLTFGVPGFQSEDLFLITPDYNTCQIILFSDQCMINKRPNFAMHGTGITFV